MGGNSPERCQLNEELEYWLGGRFNPVRPSQEGFFLQAVASSELGEFEPYTLIPRFIAKNPSKRFPARNMEKAWRLIVTIARVLRRKSLNTPIQHRAKAGYKFSHSRGAKKIVAEDHGPSP